MFSIQMNINDNNLKYVYKIETLEYVHKDLYEYNKNNI